MGLVISLALWAMMILAGMGLLRSAGQTVPAAVMSDGQGSSAELDAQVRAWGLAELDYLAEQGWHLPVTSVSAAPMCCARGHTIITPVPTQHDILLEYPVRPTEAMMRKTAAHEAAHVLMAVAGVPHSETSADLFARCFGSPLAREYAARGSPAGDCDELRRQLSNA